ncbi:MAG: PTS sugar transporter subunit IIA [Candidatus Eisenbacteria bacterium]
MSRVPALVVMHADLAGALLRAAATVYGPVDDVEVLSNEGMSRADLERAIEERVSRWAHGGLVLTDFWGGSCHMCSAIAARGHGEVMVLTGLNLPTLIDFLHNRDALDAGALAERLLKKGQDSIRLQRSQTV